LRVLQCVSQNARVGRVPVRVGAIIPLPFSFWASADFLVEFHYKPQLFKRRRSKSFPPIFLSPVPLFFEIDYPRRGRPCARVRGASLPWPAYAR